MKLLILVCFILSTLMTPVHASYRGNRQKAILMNTPNGPVRLNTPFDNQKEELKGVGSVFFGRAKVKEGKVTIWIRGCSEVEIGDISKTEDKALIEKLKSVRNGDNLRLKMGGFGKCEVSGWEKN